MPSFVNCLVSIRLLFPSAISQRRQWLAALRDGSISVKVSWKKAQRRALERPDLLVFGRASSPDSPLDLLKPRLSMRSNRRVSLVLLRKFATAPGLHSGWICLSVQLASECNFANLSSALPLGKDSSVEKTFLLNVFGTGVSPYGKFSGRKIPLAVCRFLPCLRGLFCSLLRNSRPLMVLTPLTDCGLFLFFLRCFGAPEMFISFPKEPDLPFKEVSLPQLLATLPSWVNLASFFALAVSSIASMAVTQVSSSLDSLDFCCQSGKKFSS